MGQSGPKKVEQAAQPAAVTKSPLSGTKAKAVGNGSTGGGAAAGGSFGRGAGGGGLSSHVMIGSVTQPVCGTVVTTVLCGVRYCDSVGNCAAIAWD
eukprot:3689601-Rhodomonas_salina.1